MAILGSRARWCSASLTGSERLVGAEPSFAPQPAAIKLGVAPPIEWLTTAQGAGALLETSGSLRSRLAAVTPTPRTQAAAQLQAASDLGEDCAEIGADCPHDDHRGNGNQCCD